MSDSDSFIEEVTEEVRRDQLYGYLRRYGWIAALAIVLIVAGAAFSEYRKAQVDARAEALGDAILAAYAETEAADRANALFEVTADSATGRAVLELILATELAASDQVEAAAAQLDAIAENGDVPEIYRSLAGFKSLVLQADTLDSEARRQGFSGFAAPGHPMRLLAEEQLALIDIETGNMGGAIEKLQSILQDAEATAGLQERATQVIVALGGTPERTGLSQTSN